MIARSIAISLCCACWGCHEEQPAPSPAPALPHEGINVLDPGKGPLQSLRYHLAKGTRTPVELVTDISYGEGGPKLPTLVVDLDISVDAIDPDGAAHVRTAVTHGTARGDKPELMASQVALLEGVAITLALGTDGSVLTSKVQARPDLPKGMLDSLGQLEESVGALSVTLPTVPIGVGATWKTRKTIHPTGITMIADTTYELTAIDGDKLTITRKATFSGGAQSIEREGVKLDIKSASGSLEGKTIVDLGRMVGTDRTTSHDKFAMVVAGGSADPADGPSQVEVTLVTTATPDPQPAAPAPPPQATPVDAGVDAAPPVDAKPAVKRKKKKPPPDAAEAEPVPDEVRAEDPVQ